MWQRQPAIYQKAWLYWGNDRAKNTDSLCWQRIWHKPYPSTVVRTKHRFLHAEKTRVKKRDCRVSKERLSVRWRTSWIYLPWRKRTPPLNRLNRTTNTVTKEYRCPKAVCKDCPLRSRCIGEKGAEKRIQVNIFEETVQKNHKKDGTETHTRVLLLRQIWSEGCFAAQKARPNFFFGIFSYLLLEFYHKNSFFLLFIHRIL